MSNTLQVFPNPESHYTWAIRTCLGVFVFLVACVLRVFGVPLAPIILFLVLIILIAVGSRNPITALGVVLACMPIYPVTIMVVQFFGPSFMLSDAVTAADRIALLLVTGILWRKNGIELKGPDWFVLAAFLFATVRLAFGGSFFAVLYDFNFLIAYAAGRVAVLSVAQQERWASRAVWIVAVLSVVGLAEVFLIGEGPRTVLYLAVKDAATEGGMLNGSFRAEGFNGLRESATMLGPLQFASLCMVGLVIWWVYRRDWWTGSAIAVGLLASVTRSAWMGTALAIPVVAFITNQKKRLLICAVLGVALFIASIPVVGLKEYLSVMKTGQDPSAQGHQQSIFSGLQYSFEHPLGTGPGTVGPVATVTNLRGVFIEDSYLTLAGEYGIPTALCFIAFIFSTLRLAWRDRSLLGNVSVGILLGFAAVIAVSPLHNVFTLSTWVWFPVGLLVRSH
jgi:hypothetical protein